MIDRRSFSQKRRAEIYNASRRIPVEMQKKRGPKPKPLAERFWSRVDMRDQDGCWPWRGALDGKGYGAFGESRDKRSAKAHRVAYALAFGPLNGLHVLHRCDNPPCCNPAHLWLGTNAENQADKIAKGRQKSRPLPGERNPAAKLSAKDVAAIRTAGGLQREIGARFGISQAQVSAIRLGRSWR